MYSSKIGIKRTLDLLKVQRQGTVVARTSEGASLLTVLRDDCQVLVALTALNKKMLLTLLKNFGLTLHTPPEADGPIGTLLFEECYPNKKHAAIVAKSIRLAFTPRRGRTTAAKKRDSAAKKEAGCE